MDLEWIDATSRSPWKVIVVEYPFLSLFVCCLDGRRGKLFLGRYVVGDRHPGSAILVYTICPE